MIEKLAQVEDKFSEIERKISDPEVISNHSLYQELMKKHAELQDGVLLYREFKSCSKQLAEAESLVADPEMKEIAEQEIEELKSQMSNIEEKLKLFLLPKDPNDNKNAILEIRSGTGGEEAALFAGNLFRMYTKYAEQNNWKVEVMSQNVTGIGGMKEVVATISGNKVFSKLKFESGTHRVQRVPDTETSGRIHTSAATVAIMPEAEEVDIEIETKDLRIDTFRASGAGGQHVNKTDSAIRITHIPTGVVVACQEERSQFQNKERALKVLRSKLYEEQLERNKRENADLRKGQVGSGDRSEKIRTYNYPQSRITDHRINFTAYNLEEVLNGKMEAIIEALQSAERVAKMKE